MSNQPVRGFALSFLAALFCLLPLNARAATKDLFVDASTRSMWVTATVPGEAGAPQDSLVFARAMGTDQWVQLYQIASPLLALTHQAGEPAILLSNGEWMFVFQDGRSLGPEVPAGGQLVQLASNGKTICAAAWIDGGIGALAASSRPTTAPMGQRRLVLLSYRSGQWMGLAEIPNVPAGAAISLAGTEDNLLLAWHDQEDAVQFCRWSPQKGLQFLPPVAATFKINDFKALYDTDQPMAWLAPAAGAGCLCKWDGHWGSLIKLPAPAKLAQAQSRDICVDSDQQFRMVYFVDGQLFEQIYDHRGVAAGKAAEIITQQQNDNDNSSSRWLGLAFTALLVFVLLSAFRRQQIVVRQTEQAPVIMLAPLARRLGAGIIDILPYMITVFVVLMPINPPIATYDQAVRAMNLPAVRNPIIIAMGIYLLHTTIGEIFFARSIGKFIFGLKVINLRGGQPSVLAVLARNICRPLDLFVFFLTILVSPLRQRIGDLAGGTIVVMNKMQAPVGPEEKQADQAG